MAQQDSDCGIPATRVALRGRDRGLLLPHDDACPGQFCNTAGFCQDRAGCEKNDDCLDPSLFCDTTTGTCLLVGRCTIDLHCPLGQVCDTVNVELRRRLPLERRLPRRRRAAAGTRPARAPATTPAELAACTIGVCDPNFCSDTRSASSASSAAPLRMPVRSARPPACNDYSDRQPPARTATTAPSVAGPQSCGTGAELLPHRHRAPRATTTAAPTARRARPARAATRARTSSWCGRRGGAERPTRARRTPISRAPRTPSARAAVSAPRRSGRWRVLRGPPCSIDEGDTIGICTCLEDTDCRQESCTGGECSISRRKCNPDDPDACRQIHCVDFKGAGGRLIGQNCVRQRAHLPRGPIGRDFRRLPGPSNNKHRLARPIRQSGRSCVG